MIHLLHISSRPEEVNMRLAFAKAGLWFFGIIIAATLYVLFAIADSEEKETVTTHDVTTVGLGILIIAFVIAGAIFFYTLYTNDEEERQLKNKERRQELLERRKALKKQDSKDAE
jgi:uncharacterized integral membrane protein